MDECFSFSVKDDHSLEIVIAEGSAQQNLWWRNWFLRPITLGDSLLPIGDSGSSGVVVSSQRFFSVFEKSIRLKMADWSLGIDPSGERPIYLWSSTKASVWWTQHSRKKFSICLSSGGYIKLAFYSGAKPLIFNFWYYPLIIRSVIILIYVRPTSAASLL